MIEKIKTYMALLMVMYLLVTLGNHCIVRHSATGVLYRYRYSRVSQFGILLDSLDFDDVIMVDFVDFKDYKAFRPRVS
jgi:hypothetical protein